MEGIFTRIKATNSNVNPKGCHYCSNSLRNNGEPRMGDIISRYLLKLIYLNSNPDLALISSTVVTKSLGLPLTVRVLGKI